MLRVRGEDLSVLSVKVLTKIEGCVHVCMDPGSKSKSPYSLKLNGHL